MQHWSIDILRQSGWDLWTWICIAASAVLACYALLGQLWKTRQGWISLVLIALGITGTAAIVAIPPLHDARVGLLWTLVLLCLLSAVFYLQLASTLGGRRTGTLLALRIIALVLLVPMLFEPVLRRTVMPTPTRPLALLIDTSGSMSVPDVQNGPTRLQSVWQTIGPLLPKIRAHFVPRFYTFDTDCRPLKDPTQLANLSADGKSTDIVKAINTVCADLAPTPADDDPAVMLFSDGIDNVSPDAAAAIRAQDRKIHTLSVGSTAAQPANLINVAVTAVAAPEDASVGHEVNLTATIQSSSLDNRIVDVHLAETDPNGKPLPGDAAIARRLVLHSGPGGQKIDLPYTPRSLGVKRLAVWIDPVSGERNLADNRQDVQLLAINPRIKLLYIEGSLRPEYTYLNRMLGHDVNLELATLLRLQRDRFIAGGSVDGQPFKALPTTPAQWKAFDVIIIGDLDSAFLTAAEQSQIRDAVNDGAGLIMIGGEHNFGSGGYASSPLEQALPVFVGGRSAAQDKNEFLPRLTAIGAAHPAMAGLSDWLGIDNRAPTQSLDPLRGNVMVGSAKSGAQVLLIHPGRTGVDGQPEIVLAVQQYGKGRSAAFTADTTNAWYRQQRTQGQQSVYYRFWGQLVRWLAGQDVRSRAKGPGIEALLNKSVYDFGESVKIRAMVRDEHGDATQFAQVHADITSPALAAPLASSLIPVPGHVGMYDVILPEPGEAGLPAGDYQASLTAVKDEKQLGKASLQFSVVPPAEEMLNIAANPALMETIAQQTAGYHRALAELPDLLDTLIRADPAQSGPVERDIPLANSVRVALAAAGIDVPWAAHADLPAQGLLVVVLLCAEWILRRKWQLM